MTVYVAMCTLGPLTEQMVLISLASILADFRVFIYQLADKQVDF